MKLALLFIILFPIGIQAQDYQWEFIPEKEHHKSAVEVTAGNHMGTGVIVKISDESDEKGLRDGLILTCLHVAVWDGNRGILKIKFRDGQVFSGKIVKWDAAHDFCTISVKIPKDFKAAEFSDQPAKPGDVLDAVGLGGGCSITSLKVRRFTFTAGRLTSPQLILSDEVVVPGDSGGPVFKDGKLVGLMRAGCRDQTVHDGSIWGVQGYWAAIIIQTDLARPLCFNK